MDKKGIKSTLNQCLFLQKNAVVFEMSYFSASLIQTMYAAVVSGKFKKSAYLLVLTKQNRLLALQKKASQVVVFPQIVNIAIK